MSDPNTKSHPSKLPDYGTAISRFWWDSFLYLMRVQSPLLSQMGHRIYDAVPDSATPTGIADGAHVPWPETSFEFHISVADMLAADAEAWVTMIAESAAQSGDKVSLHIAMTMSSVAEASGKVITGESAKFSWDRYLDMLEQFPVSFNENGEPNLLSIVTGPALAKTIEATPKTTEQRQREFEILKQKRKEYDARRRLRKLD